MEDGSHAPATALDGAGEAGVSGAGTRVGVGTRFLYDGEAVEVVELAATTAGNEVVLKDGRGRVQRLSLKELLLSDRACVLPDSPGLWGRRCRRDRLGGVGPAQR
ncbi:hypothetical protein JCM4914_37000 [Streptomyces platensis subsp. malvinus]